MNPYVRALRITGEDGHSCYPVYHPPSTVSDPLSLTLTGPPLVLIRAPGDLGTRHSQKKIESSWHCDGQSGQDCIARAFHVKLESQRTHDVGRWHVVDKSGCLQDFLYAKGAARKQLLPRLL